MKVRTTTRDLRQALNVYRNLCHRAGVQSHAARYAFAQERMQVYRDEGYSEREARAATSLDLGHGDGRGRYIASVYARDSFSSPDIGMELPVAWIRISAGDPY